MCVYIYIQFLRESMSPRILDFRVIKVPASPPPLCFEPSYINKYGPLVKFYNQVMFISLKIVFFFFS